MRIDKIEGYAFPFKQYCTTKGCGTTFTVDMPSDMRRVGVWTNGLVDNVIHPPRKTGERILASCPCCGKNYQVAHKSLPKRIIEKIPYDKSGDPVTGRR